MILNRVVCMHSVAAWLGVSVLDDMPLCCVFVLNGTAQCLCIVMLLCVASLCLVIV